MRRMIIYSIRGVPSLSKEPTYLNSCTMSAVVFAEAPEDPVPEQEPDSPSVWSLTSCSMAFRLAYI